MAGSSRDVAARERAHRSDGRFRPWRVGLATLAFGFGTLTACFGTAQPPVTASSTSAGMQPAEAPAVPGPTAPDAALESGLRKLGVATDAYRMADALAAAKECRELALAGDKLVLAMACNERAFLAARVLGDAKSFVAAAAWQSRHADGRGLDPAFRGVDLAGLAVSVAPLSTGIEGGSTRLDYTHPITAMAAIAGNSVVARGRVSEARPFVSVTINGKKVQALVDTGAPVPLVLDQTRARSLGAVPLVKGAMAPSTFSDPDPIPGSADYALVDSLSVGTLTMRNVLAVVMKNGKVPKSGVVVGLPMLARYPQVTFTWSQLQLDTRPETCKEHPLPMTAMLAARGAFGMVFPIQVRDKHADAIFDTGMSFPLAIGPTSRLASTLAPASSKQPLEPAFTIHPGSLSVGVGRINLKPDHVYVSRLGLPTDAAIGSPLLLGADVRINFNDLSLFVIPRSAWRVR